MNFNPQQSPIEDVSSANNTMTSSINMADPATDLSSTTPNSKPRLPTGKKIQKYVYQDFANAEPSKLNTGTCHERVPPQSLQSQKLPSKLAAMLSDPDLASILTWMPHGRSWKILNRDLFATFALPRYFGHSNHASFVRIVNAWGFRRITKGPDRDSYYHELFLRGKPRLHERMKRLPTCHRKTPVDKDEKCPDFYELAKTSPLAEVSWALPGSAAGSAVNPTMNQANAMSQVAAGYGNPMATTSLGMGMGMMNHGANLYGNAGTSAPSAMDSYLSNTSNHHGNNDIPSLLKLLRQQGTLQQQQQQANNSSQNLMHFLRMQQQGKSASPSQPSSLSGNAAGSTLGQLASVASFAQPPAAASSSSNTNAMINSLTGMNGVGQQQRRLSNDKISVNDVIQLRSIERTNELLAQKLALMQQDTMMMQQSQNPVGAPSPAQSLPHKTEVLNSTSPSVGNSISGGPSKEEMLLQMIRRENQRNGGPSLAGTTTSTVPTKVEDGAGNMSRDLNHFLKSLNGMQQQPSRSI